MSKVQMIAINKIRVLNPRSRSKAKFKEIVENVSKVGLKKPVTVCPRPGSGGEYDLVCGQGRIEALSQLGQTHVPAIVVSASRDDRYLMSLVENIARKHPGSLDLARDIAALEQRGYTPAQISTKIGISETYIRGVLRLHAKGEELLLAAVERGDLPIAVACQIAAAKDDDVKRCLAEAYERGDIRGRAISKARTLVERRLANGRRLHGGSSGRVPRKVSTDTVVRTLRRSTAKHLQLVRKAKVCDQMLRIVRSSLQRLIGDAHFSTLLRAEGLDAMPTFLAEQLKEAAP